MLSGAPPDAHADSLRTSFESKVEMMNVHKVDERFLFCLVHVELRP